MTAFKCGDRVRKRGEKMKGYVTQVGRDARCSVDWDNGYTIREHTETLKRIKPKAESKPREFWLHSDGRWYDSHLPLPSAIHVREVREDEIVTSRDNLKRTYETLLIQCGCIHMPGLAFEHFEELLNLPSPEGKGGMG